MQIVSSPRCAFFFLFPLFFFTNFNYRYITFTGTITTAITGPATSLTTVPAVSATAVALTAAGGGARDATCLEPPVCSNLIYLIYYTNNDRYQNWMTTPPIQQHNNSIGGDRSSGGGAAGRDQKSVRSFLATSLPHNFSLRCETFPTKRHW